MGTVLLHPNSDSVLPPCDCWVVLDDAGLIREVSEEWKERAIAHGLEARFWQSGTAYRDYCTGSSAQLIKTNIDSLIEGDLVNFCNVYDCGTGSLFVPVIVSGRKIGTGRFLIRHTSMNHPRFPIAMEWSPEQMRRLCAIDPTGMPAARDLLSHLLRLLDDLFSAHDAALNESEDLARRLGLLFPSIVELLDDALEIRS